jgi:hypothetical protein
LEKSILGEIKQEKTDKNDKKRPMETKKPLEKST